MSFNSFESYVPDILVQSFASGDDCTGVAYTGLSPARRVIGELGARDPLNGVAHVSSKSGSEVGPIDGGLFDLSEFPKAFFKITGLMITLPGVTAITVYAVSSMGHEFQLATVSAAQLVSAAPTAWALLPGWSIKVAATGTLTGDGLVVIQCEQWNRPANY